MKHLALDVVQTYDAVGDRMFTTVREDDGVHFRYVACTDPVGKPGAPDAWWAWQCKINWWFEWDKQRYAEEARRIRAQQGTANYQAIKGSEPSSVVLWIVPAGTPYGLEEVEKVEAKQSTFAAQQSYLLGKKSRR